MAQPSLIISLAAEFIGKKAFKQAETSTERLTKSVKSLAKTFGLAFGTAKILAYGKASVKAAAEDAKAQALLANQLKNVGQSYAIPEVNAYISQTEKLTGILDDQLRPAFSKLVTVTGSATQSQKLLNIAIDAAAGTSQDVLSVSQALAQAYAGNTKGLKALNLGYTGAELKAKSFEEILTRINELYKGAGKVATNSYAGSLLKINTAAKNASETIGFGLIDAIKNLNTNGSVDTLTESMTSLSTVIADDIRGVGVLLGEIDKLGGGGPKPPAWLEKLIYTGPAGLLLNVLGKKSRTSENMGKGGGYYQQNAASKLDAIAAAKKAKADKLQAALLAKQLAAQKALLKNQKDQVLQKKLGAIFDLEQIQIVAALKGKISEQDRIKLQLQSALLMGNTDEAARLTLELANSVGLTTQLGQWLSSLPTAANPFEAWESFLYGIQKQVNAIIASVAAGTNVLARFSPSTQASIISSVLSPELFAGIAAGSSATGVSPIGNNASSEMAYRNAVQAATVVVNVAGSVTTQQDLVTAIQNGLYTRQSTGNAAAYLAP